MPSTATITAFYTFTGNSRPRVGQVNANFSNFRGHLIPIDPNLPQGSNMNYDLGSSEHRWRVLYVNKIDIGLTSTSTITIEADTAGSFSFKNNGVEFFNVNELGLSGYDSAPVNGMTTVGDVGDIAASGALNVTLSSATHVSGSTCTLSTNGRPVFLGLISDNSTSTASYVATSRSFSGALSMVSGKLSFARDGVLISGADIRSGGLGSSNKVFPGCFTTIDTPAAGTYHFSLYSHTVTTGGVAGYVELNNVKVFAIEL